ncbi:hypothetical protein [Nocardia abscessus]|uniref:hypothetical protein n=1 Tax=Nocardia abscessus TaxID=120957 RepID=UPI002458C071|nr:hypothetical protein [Nocardia abscessus]
MPDGYDRDRDRVKSHERGRIFENGTYRYFRDRENGFVQQSEKFRAAGVKIRFDKISKDAQGCIKSIEEKSGRMEGPKDEKQLRAVRELLDRGVIHQHVLRSVEGEFRSPEVQKLIDELVRDFGDKFTHQIIPRAVAREIWAMGVQREAGQQLELPGIGEKARQQKAQQREQRAKAAEVVQKARDRAEKLRKMLRFREGASRGREVAQRAEHARQVRELPERVREARHSPEAERARVEREAAERVAQEFPAPSQFQEREGADSTEKVASAEREAAEARAAAEAAGKAQDQVRDAAFKELDEKGLLSEVERLLWLGQGTHPQAAVRQSPGAAPSVERGGTGQGQDRSRVVSRDR